MIIGDLAIGKYGRLVDGTLFRVSDTPINEIPDHGERVVVLYPHTVKADERRFPTSTPCKADPKWNAA